MEHGGMEGGDGRGEDQNRRDGSNIQRLRNARKEEQARGIATVQQDAPKRSPHD